MFTIKYLRVFALTLILLVTLVGQSQAQGQQPPPQQPSVAPTNPPGMGERVAGSQIPARAAADLSPQAITLGAPGLSFRYVQTFGVTEEAYPADVQHMNNPNGIYIDGSDNLFVVEWRGQRVLKYRTSDKVNLLSIGKAGLQSSSDYSFDNPSDVAVDGDGNFWVAVSNRSALVKYDSGGNFLLAFPNDWTSGNDNNHFNQTRGLAFDNAGRLFVADGNNSRIQVFDMVGGTPVYQTTIGETGVAGSDNNHFNFPSHLAFDSSGRLYVADSSNFRVQRCTFASSAWTCATFFGEANVTATDLAHLGGWFNGLTIRNDNIFIADNNNHRVLKCTTLAACAIFAGVTGVIGSDNAHFWGPSDVSVDSIGNVYVSEYENARVQEFSSAGAWVKTFGVTQVPYLPDTLRINTPHGLTVAADGSIYLVEGWGVRLIKLNSAGVQQWARGQAGQIGWDNAHFNFSWWDGLAGNPAVDATGKVYVADTGNDRIRIFDAATGDFLTNWGSSGSGPSQFSCPWGVAISPVNGDFYVVDRCNNRIQVFDSNRVYKTQLGGGIYGSGNTEFASPQGVAVDKNGIIYVADMDNNRVQKCTLSGSVYACSLFAGETGVSGSDFGHLSGPYSVAVDSSHRVYVADAWNQRVQVFDPTGAYLTTIGNAWGNLSGQLREPKGVALDSQGNVYISDSRNSRIQKFAPGVPGWKQANINGFGNRNNWAIHRMSVFNGYLYASTDNLSTGGEVWRTQDGHTWAQVNTGGFSDPSNQSILLGETFGGYLYAGTGNSSSGAELWRCATCDGSDWTQVVDGGFGDINNTTIERVVVFSNTLYATVDNPATGVEVWKSPTGNPGSWTQFNADGFGDGKNTGLWGAAVFNGYLYAGTSQWEVFSGGGTQTGAEVWRTNGVSPWSQVNADGFGSKDNFSPWLEPFNGYLYAISVNFGTGAQVWRCATCDGSDWERVVADGFGNINNYDGSVMLVFNSHLYACASNSITGTEIWRTANGRTWSQVNLDGFGDSNNVAVWGGAGFNGRLFLGTINQVSWQESANGAEVWEMLSQIYLPILRR